MKLSRRCALLILLAAAAPVPALAQTEPASKAAPDSDAAMARKLLTSPTITGNKPKCYERSPTGDIVVCAPDNDQFRIKSTAEEDPNSRQALDDGRLHPPNVSGLPDCSPGSKNGCIGIGRAPPPLYIIDLDAIPQAPAGSDADKVAKGEMRAN